MGDRAYRLAVELRANATGFSAGVNTAAGDLRRLDGHLAGTASQADRLAGALGRVAHYGVAGGALYGIATGAQSTARELFNASAGAERLRVQLGFATDGRAAREMGFVADVAQRLGLNLTVTAQSYAGFAAAARGTALEGQRTRDVFEAVAQASAVMGLSTDQTSGALLAIQQMMSKGVVSAEEFRGQLGERMPIALQAGARALGMTTREFTQMLETGQIVAQDFLPKFATAIREMLGDSVDKAADRLDAGVARMENAWQRLKQTAGDTGLSQGLATEAKAVGQYLDSISDAMERARRNGAGTAMQLLAGLGTVVARVPFETASFAANTFNGALNILSAGVLKLNTSLNLTPVVLQTTAAQAAAMGTDLERAKGKLVELQARAEREGQHLYLKSEIFQTRQYVAELETAIARQAQLRGSDAGAGRGVVNPDTVAQTAARQKALTDRRDALLRDIDGVPDGYLKKVNELIALQQEGAITGREYEQALAKLQTQLLKTGQAAKDAAQMGLDRVLAEIERGQVRELAVQRRSMDELEALREAGLVDQTAYVDQRRRLAEQDIATQEALVRRQIEAVQRSGIEPKEKIKAIERYNEELEKLRQQGFDIEAADVNRLTVLAAKRKTAIADANLAQIEEAQAARAKAVTDYGIALNGAMAQVNQYAASVANENELLQTEAGLIGATAQARAVAIAQLQIEFERRRQVLEIQKRGLTATDQEAQIARINADAARAALQATQRVQLDEWGKTVDLVDTTWRDGFRAMLNRSEGTWAAYVKSLKNTFKSGLADELYKMFARPFVLQFMGGVTGMGSAAAASAAGGAGSALGTAANVGSLAAGVGAFGSGVATGWGSGMASLGGGIVNGAHTIATGAGTAQGLGMIAGDPVTMAIVLGLAAASKLFGSKGGPKNESWSGYSGAANDPWGRFNGELQAGGSAGAKLAQDLGTSIVGAVKGALAAVGIAGTLAAGVYVSQDPKGDSATQLDVQARLNGTAIYNRADRVGDVENIGRSEDELKAAVAQETLQVFLAALQASGEAVPRYIERFTAGLDAGSTADEVNAVLAAIADFPNRAWAAFGTSRDAQVQAMMEGARSGGWRGVGEAFAGTLLGGIETAMAGNFFGQLTDIVGQQVVMPMLSSLQAGATVAEAMAEANMQAMVAKAQAAATAFGAVWGDADFQAALVSIRDTVSATIGGAVQASGYVPRYTAAIEQQATSVQEAAQLVDRQRALSIEIARLEGRALAATAMEREDELKTLDAGSAALQKRVYALQDEAAALRRTRELLAAFDGAVGSFQSEPERIAYGFERVARELVALGVAGEISVGELAQVLRVTGRERIAEVTRSFLSLSDVSDETKTQVLGLVGTIGQLKDESAEAERNLASAGASLADTYAGIVDRAKQSGERVQDALGGITDGYVGAQERVATAQEAVDAIARQAAESMRGFAKSIREFVAGIDSSDLGGRSKREQLAAAQAQFAIAAAQARAGDPEALGRLTGLAGTVLNLSRDTSRSQLALSRNADSVRATLNEIAFDQERKAIARLDGVSAAQDPTAKALKALTDAQDDLARWSQAVSVSGASTARTVADYLKEWREAVADDSEARADLSAATAAMQGISVAQTSAMERLSSEIGAYTAALLARDGYAGRMSPIAGPPAVTAGGPAAAGPRIGAADMALGQSIASALGAPTAGGGFGEAGIRAAFEAIRGSGQSLDHAAGLFGADASALRDVARAMGIPGFASGGAHTGGIRLVGERGPELEVTGPARIYSAAQTRDLLGGGGGNAQMAAEIRRLHTLVERLTAEVVQLRQDNSAENLAIAKGSLESAAKLRKLDQIGIGART